MSAGAGMSIALTTTMPTPRALKGRIDGAAREVLRRWGGTIKHTFQESWVGWEYKGRPATAPRLVSYDAWSFVVDSTGGGRDSGGRFRPNLPCVIVYNEARDYRSNRSYVAAVHRAGRKGRPEWIEVARAEVGPLIPMFARELTQAFAVEVQAPQPRRRLGTSGGAETASAGMVL